MIAHEQQLDFKLAVLGRETYEHRVTTFQVICSEHTCAPTIKVDLLRLK